MAGFEGVAIGKDGEIIVTDRDNYCVSVFSSGGKKLRSFGPPDIKEGYLCGVAVDGDRNILVVDGDSCRVLKFTMKGKFVTETCLNYDFPFGIVYSPETGKVYVGHRGGRVQVLTSDLNGLGDFGEAGSSEGQLSIPRHIACDSAGNVYVADCYNHRIQVFTAEGQFLRTFGRHGVGRGELDRPSGVAVDANGKVYVTELKNNRVSVFTCKGEFVTSFGENAELTEPSGVAVDSTGVVYVCDGKRNITVF